MLDRAYAVSSNAYDRDDEISRIYGTLKSNNYPKQFLNKVRFNTTKFNESNNSRRVVLPYVKGLSER